MTRTRQEEYSQILGGMITDKINMKLIIDSVINAEVEEDNAPTSKRDRSSNGALLDNISKNRSKIDTSNIPGIQEEDQQDFKDVLEVEGGKRFRQYQIWEPPKFKLLGHSQTGLPIFKISDVFMTSDPKLRNIIDKEFNDIIYGGKKVTTFETGQLSKKFDKGYDLQKMVENWKNKQYEDFQSDKKNRMDQEELQQIVVNRGDQKNNYWLYKNKQKKRYTYEDIDQGKVQIQNYPQRERVNHYLTNPNFYKNLQKAVKQKKLQYINIEQFDSDDEDVEKKQKLQKKQKQKQKEKQRNKPTINNINNLEEKEDSDQDDNDIYEEDEGEMEENREQEEDQNSIQQDQNSIVYWGEIKNGKNNKNKKIKKRPPKNVLVEDQIIQEVTTDPKKATDKIVTPRCTLKIRDNGQNQALVDEIIKQYNIVNQEVIQNCYKGKESLEKYNRIELHLQNPDFFMTKLHFALQKKSQQFHNYVQGTNRSTIGMEKRNLNPSVFQSQNRDQSVISGSLTGNQQTIKASNMEGRGMGFSQDDHETIEQKILKQMNHYTKKPIKHSEVATKLLYIKFSTLMEEFNNYHRHQFKYDYYLKNPARVQLIRHAKPLKNKGTDLDINLEKQDPHKKFSRSQNLSFASEQFKQFILVEYIEENPLLMSDVGMCERMVLQANYHQIINKVQRDLIEDFQFQKIQELRDNPQQSRNYNNISTEQKMKLWRKAIIDCFGENGKVYLWEPKREGKLIGNPEGPGVSLMESNLAVVPVVKKTPNKRDFLLVRDGNKWVLRKIDTTYVSGQVEPKQVVFSHGDRPYQSFLQKYQMDFIKKFAAIRNTNKVSIEQLKFHFPNTPNTSAQSRIRKILKQKMRAVTKDNKVYQIVVEENDEIKYMLKPEQFCLYQRMQKSLCQLADSGITIMKNMEKMKSILKKYFKKNPTELELFATARMIRDQLQLTSWYLTESFHKFIEKKARIQMCGHADPTNGHGGYSFIKKPQKQRTDKQEAQQKQQKVKLSGTVYDLRKLRAEDSIQILQKKGYNPAELKNKTRWELVDLVKRQKDTEYSRKERETKEQKQENQRKERSRCFNKLLKILKNEQEGGIQTYEYNYNGTLDLSYYCAREERNWINCKNNLERKLRGQQEEFEDDDGDDDDDS